MGGIGLVAGGAEERVRLYVAASRGLNARTRVPPTSQVFEVDTTTSNTAVTLHIRPPAADNAPGLCPPAAF